MTEREWGSSVNPRPMLEYLAMRFRGSDRQFRLFAVACCRRVWSLLVDARSRRLVEVAEAYADGAEPRATLAGAMADARKAYDHIASQVTEAIGPHRPYPSWWAASAARDTARPEGGQPKWFVALDASRLAISAQAASSPGAIDVERAAQARLVRDIFGNSPFHALPPIDSYSSLHRWNEGLVMKLAQTAYEDRLLPSGELDPARLAILGDALEEAGCDNEEMLAHCRQQEGVHVRGCWCLDLLLQRWCP
jgi:hypothetical protein